MSSIPPLALVGKTITFNATIHDPVTMQEADPDSAPTYRIYANDGDTPILTGTMDKRDDANTVGTYSKEVSTVGWVEYATYTVKIRAVVDGKAGGITLSTLCIYAPWERPERSLTSSSTAPGVGLVAREWRVMRGDTLVRTFDTIAADASVTKVQLTIKRNVKLGDDKAILAIDSKTGVIRLLERAPTATENIATFVLPTAVLTIPATLMSKLSVYKYDYDVQVWRGIQIQTIEQGTMRVIGDATWITAASASMSESLSPSASESISESASPSPSA